jgi:membrane protease YdiL (CAAX protease family)
MADKPPKLPTATWRPLPTVVVMAVILLVCLALVPWAFTHLLRPTPTSIIGVAQYFVLLAAVLPLMRWKRTPAESPLSKAAPIDHVGVAMIATLAMFAISIATGWFLQLLGVSSQTTIVVLRGQTSELLRWTEFFKLVALAPVAEEIAFRGFLLGSLRHWKFGFWPAAGLTTIAWMLMHASWSPHAVLIYFGLGMTLSWVLLRTERIWPCVLAHAAYNGVPAALVLFYLE